MRAFLAARDDPDNRQRTGTTPESKDPDMGWLYLAIAGLLEVVWAVGLKYTQGFTKPLASAITIAAMLTSLALLGLALKQLPVGVAYGIWVGIGAVGAAILGIFLFAESASPLKFVSLALIVAGIAGLKASA